MIQIVSGVGRTKESPQGLYSNAHPKQGQAFCPKSELLEAQPQHTIPDT